MAEMMMLMLMITMNDDYGDADDDPVVDNNERCKIMTIMTDDDKDEW